MSLSERVKQPEQASKTGLPCSVGEVYRLLEGQPEEIEALNFVLYGTTGWGRTAFQVVKFLEPDGFKVSPQQVNRHRGKRCRCF